MIKDQKCLLEVSLQWHLYNPFFLCNNTVLLLRKGTKRENLNKLHGSNFPDASVK